MQIVKIYMVKSLNLTPHLAVYHEILLYTCYCHAFSRIKRTRNVLEEEGIVDLPGLYCTIQFRF